MRCRICNALTKKFLDLGKAPLPEEFRKKNNLNNKINKYKIGMEFCLSCSHVQLDSIVSKNKIYKLNYFYDYSVTQTGKKHWLEFSDEIIKKYKPGKEELLVDIGSNTGVLLSIFKNKKFNVLGVDPSEKHARIATKNGIPTLIDFFSERIARKIALKNGQAKIITCNNTFDHVYDLNEFMKGLSVLLKKKGVFIFEVPYFKNMLENLTHIPYHQQIDYILVTPLLPFFEKYNMQIYDAKLLKIHGGSIRVYVSFKGVTTPKKRLLKIIADEKLFLRNWEIKLNLFAKKTKKQRDNLIKFIVKSKENGKTICGIGASAKGITLLNYCGVDAESIDFITEKSPLKIGLFTPTKIPIKSDDSLLEKKPDFAIILAWNFRDEIINNLKNYKDKGGSFIVPIPKLKILR